MAAEIVEEQTTVLDALDQGLDPVCGWLIAGHEHGVVADWFMVLDCCGNSKALCEPHRGDVVDMMRVYKSECARCGAASPTVTWVPIRAGR